MKISLCMIVKNEETMIQQSLSRVTPYIDELIVVDTGSTDRTKEIALNFTKKVYDFQWSDDFSAARNFALDQATNNWVLVLDADEVVTDFSIEQIRKATKIEYPWIGRIKLINIIENEIGEKRVTERIGRFFNRKYFRYEGMIHEQLVRKDGNVFKPIPVEITVEHKGYTQEAIKRTNKISRNMTLLQEALEKSPEDPYWLYQLGKSYSMAHDYRSAIAYYEQVLALPLNFSLEYVEDLVESYGYALLNSGCYQEALRIKNYGKYYNHSVDHMFLMGHIYMNNGQFSSAIEHFLRCIGEKEGKLEGMNSYLPAYNIAVIYDCLGQKTKAVFYYQQCGNYSEALKRLRIDNE